ncbi:MAG: hypothetical protein RIS94_2898, partial [Pseudomonadota bacterium]
MNGTLATMAAGIAIVAPLAAQAEPVQLASDVFVERFQPAADGRMSRVLERAERLQPGDRVVFVVNWTATRGRDFTVTNPLPRAVSFQSSAGGDEEVSVDGGHSWGTLDQLTVRDGDGRVRHAVPEDVTHLRWRVPGAMAALG